MVVLRFAALLVLVALSVSGCAPLGRSAGGRPLVFVHYMAVGAAKPYRNDWGFMWSMGGSCNPDRLTPAGQREICSHYSPVIGPYDASDPSVLEYHALLMHLSGVDGVIFDWFGRLPLPGVQWTVDQDDSTVSMTHWLERAGLRYALMLEDAPFRTVQAAGRTDPLVYASQTLMPYVQSQYLNRPAYLRVQGRPVLLSWGPTFVQFRAQKEQLLGRLHPRPWWVTLDWNSETADAGYAWVPDLPSQESQRRLNERYAAAASERGWPFRISSAYPGFDDFFDPNNPQGFRTRSLGHIDARNGQTFQEGLNWAGRQQPEIVQVVTWNDYAEGTMIEPTLEFGTRYLEQLQQFTGVPYRAADLRLPLRLYRLRHTLRSDPAAQGQLDQAFREIVAGQAQAATARLGALEAQRPPLP